MRACEHVYMHLHVAAYNSKENEALKKEASRPTSTDVHHGAAVPAPLGGAYDAGETAAAAEALRAALQGAHGPLVGPATALLGLVAGVEAAAAAAVQVGVIVLYEHM